MDEDELELQLQGPNSFFDGIEEVLVADCASEAVIDANGILVDQQDDDKGNCEDYFMISCNMESTRQWDDIFNILKEKDCHQEFYIQLKALKMKKKLRHSQWMMPVK